MKSPLRLAVVFALGVATIPSCKKGPEVPLPATSCKITNFTFTSSVTNPSDSAIITYYDDGNPRTVTMGGVSTGSPRSLFIYDQYKRLTDHIGAYSGVTDPLNLPAVFTFEFWHRYVYADVNAASLPVSDTFRVIGGYSGGTIIGASQTMIEKFVYDSDKRIIQVNSTGTMSSSTTNYTYDANGNLVSINANYDTRKNFRQTNKVWMLVDRNFSKNNRFVATQYNAEGYPTLFPAPVVNQYQDVFLKRSVNFKTMNYDCGMAAGGK